MSPTASLPPGLVPELLDRFSSSEGYKIYPDVLPFFQALSKARREPSPDGQLIVGILTNSDDRVSQILSSLGLQVGDWRYGSTSSRKARGDDTQDVDLVALSYDIGFSKPNSRIFDATKSMVQEAIELEPKCFHAGDNLQEDYRAADDAGWNGILVDREGVFTHQKVTKVTTLLDVVPKLGFKTLTDT